MKFSFSVVIPVHPKDIPLISKSLSSYLALKPNEVLLCVDAPIPIELREVINKIANQCEYGETVRILEVPRGGWGDQQMKSRRTGFGESRNNKILSGDIDLVVSSNVFKALRMVGENNVGMVSVSKFRTPTNIMRFVKLLTSTFLKTIVHKFTGFSATSFTGLYAISKHHWREVEPTEEARKYSMIKRKIRDKIPVTLSDLIQAGEDSFLRDHMIEKFKVVYLPDIGAYVLSDPLEDTPLIQYSKGVYFATLKSRNDLIALARSILRIQPYYFVGHLYGKKLRRFKHLDKVQISFGEDFSFDKWKRGGTPLNE